MVKRRKSKRIERMTDEKRRIDQAAARKEAARRATKKKGDRRKGDNRRADGVQSGEIHLEMRYKA